MESDMLFIPREQHKKLMEFNKKLRDKFIENCLNADWEFVAIVEAMYESPNFKSYPQEQQKFVEDFINARKK